MESSSFMVCIDYDKGAVGAAGTVGVGLASQQASVDGDIWDIDVKIRRQLERGGKVTTDVALMPTTKR